MSQLHPQVAQLLERIARSALPLYHTLPAHVARRVYHDTRAVLAPPAPEVAEARLVVIGHSMAARAYRPAGAGKGDPSEVDLITGATISSRTVVRIINNALARLGPALETGAEAP